jgi:hypothetical protein
MMLSEFQAPEGGRRDRQSVTKDKKDLQRSYWRSLSFLFFINVNQLREKIAEVSVEIEGSSEREEERRGGG